MGQSANDLLHPLSGSPWGWKDEQILSTLQSCGPKSAGGGVSEGPTPPSAGTHNPQFTHISWKVLPCAALAMIPGSNGVGICPKEALPWRLMGRGHVLLVQL